jgi:hypothetical protein
MPEGLIGVAIVGVFGWPIIFAVKGVFHWPPSVLVSLAGLYLVVLMLTVIITGKRR